MIEIPGYTLSEVIHKGRQTLVYRGIRSRDKLPVILKTPVSARPDLNALARLRREYELLAELDEPYIIKAMGLEPYRKTLFLVLEDISGTSLKQLLSAGPLSLERFLPLARVMVDALEQVHKRLIIHKGLEPGNFVVDENLSALRIIDFGIASLLTRENRSQSTPTTLEGTLAYMSPEQTGRMNRSIDYRSDYYTLGLTFYEMLTGEPAFPEEDPLEVIHSHMARKPKLLHQINEDLPPAVGFILDKLLAKAPEDRYQTAYGILRDLDEARNCLSSGTWPADFRAGSKDMYDHFQIPEKLYGRKNELNKLKKAFNRVSQGYSGMFVIGGYAGMGKSLLVREQQRAILARRGYFIFGKFDQLKRDIPYATLITAFKDVVHTIFTESRERLNHWRERLEENLGANARLIMDEIPELELILGPKPLVPRLPTSEAQNRFQLVFLNFVKTFAAREHPLVLFLDDLHWADSASMALLKLFLTDFDSRYILIVGTYRSNECSGNHPLMLTLEELRILGANVSRVQLEPLALEDIREMVVDTFHRNDEDAHQLARLCMQKTSGNPFFLTQLLEELYDLDLVGYNRETGRWEWDTNAVEEMQVTNNLVEFMLQKIRRLSPQTQRVLQLAACIGNTFELDVLALVHERTPRDTAEDLWEVLKEGLIIPLDDAYKFPDNVGSNHISYRFLHDRVHQAAYGMLDEEQKKVIHLRLGRLLFGKINKGELEERAFDIVNQLNLGIDLIASRGERNNLARINLIAGKKAKLSSAYEAALNYYETGINLLEKDSWQTDHDLAFTLYLERAECQHLCGMPNQAEASFDIIFGHIHTRLEKAEVYAIKILVETHLSRTDAAIQAGLDGLALFGITFPDRPDFMEELERKEVLEIQAFLEERLISDLLDLPAMEDADHLVVMHLLMNMTPPIYYTNPALFRLVILEMINTSLQHGNAASSTFAYVNFGAILITRFDAIHAGYQMGCLALELGTRYERAGLTYKVKFVFATFVNHWVNHIKTSLDIYKQAHYYAMESGDLLFASYVAHHYLDAMFFRGEALHDIHDYADRYLEICSQNNVLDDTLIVRLYLRMAMCLRGETNESASLSGKNFDEEAFVTELKKRGSRHPLIFYYIHKCGLLLIDDRPTHALKYAEKAHVLIEDLAGMLYYAEHHFYYSLAITRAIQSMSSADVSRYLGILEQNLSLLEKWSQHAPANFKPRHLLITAEQARIRGERWQAMELYEQAINASRSHELIHMEALCHERSGRFWIEQGKPDFAHLHMVRAHYDYQLWGASVKSETLEKLFVPGMPLTGGASGEEQVMPTSAFLQRTRYEYLDLSTVFKASQAISGNLVLEDLLKNMMHILLENAGAQHGCLVLTHEDEHADDFRVEAEGEAENRVARVLSAVPLDEYPRLSPSVINYALRTKEFVVLNDAAAEGLFTADPYILETKPKSVLCLPIIHQNSLYGALYLENNLTTGAFTAERLEVLRILASQAAISIRKARIYAQLERYSQDLESRVAERTNELEKKNQELGNKNDALIRTQKQLVLQEKMASIGVLTAGIAHEIRNPLNFITNFARVTLELSKELRDLVEGQRELLDPAVVADIDDILESFEQNTRLIDRHGERANQIVKGMLRLSKGNSGVRRPTNIQLLLDEFVKLAYQGMYAQGDVARIEIVKNYPEEASELTVDAQEVGRAFLNLVNNACYSMTQKRKRLGEKFQPVLEITTSERDKMVEITIADNGEGIPENIQDKIFNPFFTTKPANGEHIGLGLSISYDIVRGHQGDIRVISKEGENAIFKILLPNV